MIAIEHLQELEAQIARVKALAAELSIERVKLERMLGRATSTNAGATLVVKGSTESTH